MSAKAIIFFCHITRTLFARGQAYSYLDVLFQGETRTHGMNSFEMCGKGVHVRFIRGRGRRRQLSRAGETDKVHLLFPADLAVAHMPEVTLFQIGLDRLYKSPLGQGRFQARMRMAILPLSWGLPARATPLQTRKAAPAKLPQRFKVYNPHNLKLPTGRKENSHVN